MKREASHVRARFAAISGSVTKLQFSLALTPGSRITRLTLLTPIGQEDSLTRVLRNDKIMETTKLSSKGQVIIPKALRDSHHWQTGLELMAIDTGDGVLLKPKAPFPATELAQVAGMLRGRTSAKSDADIKRALVKDIRGKWRGRN